MTHLPKIPRIQACQGKIEKMRQFCFAVLILLTLHRQGEI